MSPRVLGRDTVVSCLRGGWFAARRLGWSMETPSRRFSGEAWLSTDTLPPPPELARHLAAVRAKLRTFAVRRGHDASSVCWPRPKDVVWVSGASVVLAMPVAGPARVTASVATDAARSFTSDMEVAGDVVDAEELRAWLGSVQDSIRRVPISMGISHAHGKSLVTFLLASEREEISGRAGFPKDRDDSGLLLLDRAAAWLANQQLGPAYRDAGRASWSLRDDQAFAMVDSIRTRMKCP